MDIKTININNVDYSIGNDNKGLTDGIKNALILLGQNVSYKNENGDDIYANLLRELNADELEYTSLCENYSPNLAAFTFPTVYVDFSRGDYIEAVIDREHFTQNGGQLFSVGENISTWGGWNYHIPAFPSTTSTDYDLSINVFAGTVNNRSIKYKKNGEDYLIIQIRSNGLYINGVKIFADDDTNEAAWLAHFTPSIGIQIGSSEGKVRSDALYKHVRIYRGTGS